MTGLNQRNSSYLEGPFFKKIFARSLSPYLENSQVIWVPYLIKYTENVQHRETNLQIDMKPWTIQND